MIAKTEAQYIAEKMPMARALARKLMWQWHVVGMDDQDVAQEGLIGYLRAMRRHAGINGASLDTYAGRRMIGAMMDAVRGPMRSERRIPGHALADLECALDVSGEDGRAWVDAMHAQQTLERAYQRFADLPSKQRQAMELMYVGGLSQREVARQINVTEGNVSILHSRAVKNLRKMLIN